MRQNVKKSAEFGSMGGGIFVDDSTIFGNKNEFLIEKRSKVDR